MFGFQQGKALNLGNRLSLISPNFVNNKLYTQDVYITIYYWLTSFSEQEKKEAAIQ